jgi:hypothetical protein
MFVGANSPQIVTDYALYMWISSRLSAGMLQVGLRHMPKRKQT